MTTKPQKKVCKHNGGRGYWSSKSGSMCLSCGEEMIERRFMVADLAALVMKVHGTPLKAPKTRKK